MKSKKDAFNDLSIKVPFVFPNITRIDKLSITRALNSILLTDGPKLQQFENAFSKYTKSKYAIGVSNATSALSLVLNSLDIKNGDEVIVPNLTFVATASVVVHSGATPVLADVELNSLNIDPKSIQKNITKKTRAIIPVHFAGRACNIHQIVQIAKKHDLKIIEDCAHALGTRIGNQHVGTFGHAGCFSFYPTKNITSIEGGMIITNSKLIFDNTISARNHGITRTLHDRFSHGMPWDYDITKPGFNYRLDEIRSSLGLSQLKRLDKLNHLRKSASNYYDHYLKNVKGIKIPALSKNHENSFHLYVVRITKDSRINRDELFSKLLKLGIRTSVHYKPLNKFTLFKKLAKSYDSLKNSELLYDEILSLPLYPTISRTKQDFVIKSIKQLLD